MKSKADRPDGVLVANVNQALAVHREGHADVRLEIEATNKTNGIIALTKPYKIPAAHVCNVLAYDVNGDSLEAYHNERSGYIEIVFKPNTVLPPNHKFKFHISYRTSQFGKKCEGNEFLAVFSITPQNAYKQVPIQNHRLSLVVNFKKPKPKIWWLFKRISVIHCANHHVPLNDKQNKWDRTELQFTPCDLGRDSNLRMTFHYSYSFSPESSTVWSALTVIIPEVIKRILGK